MNTVDGIISPPYFIKSLIKATLFLGAPIIYFVKYKDERTVLKELFTPKKKPIFTALAMGVTVYAVITLGYILIQNSIDFSAIAGSLEKSGITAENFIFVSLYIAFCNSLLEEIFFRGFGFMTLKNHINRKIAYALSAGLFAFYHIGMTLGWVEIYLFALGFLGLFLGGIFFSYLAEKTKSIYPSWILHMFVNFGINTVGFMLLGVI